MKSDKVRQFLELAGQTPAARLEIGSESNRKLGAQLLLSELMEYIVRGLGVVPEYQGVKLNHPEAFTYHVENKPDIEEMVDGLGDVAYTMYWNSEVFGIPLEEAYDLICDNNLEKFVRLDNWTSGERILEKSEWNCGKGVSWPEEVAEVSVKLVQGMHFAVGKDARGKVRKPSTYKPVDLSALLS